MLASELAARVGGILSGDDRPFTGVAPIESAGPDHLAYLTSPPKAPVTAGVVLAQVSVDGVTTVAVRDPKLAFIQALEILFPEVHPAGAQPGAHVDPTVRIAPNVSIYPGAYVGPDVEIGEGTVIFPNAVVMAGTIIGRRCRIGPAAVVGYAGFGVHPTREGLRPVPQVGRVVIDDGVSIGACTCVDRAFLAETRIGAGSQIDNLVQVGHNCQLGRNVVIAGLTGLSGSVTLEDGVVLAGQVGIADHVRVGAGAQVGAQSGLNRDLEGGRRWLGSPAWPVELAVRIYASLRELPDLVKRVRKLERRLGPHNDGEA